MISRSTDWRKTRQVRLPTSASGRYTHRKKNCRTLRRGKNRYHLAVGVSSRVKTILANSLPAFSLPAQSIFLNFARFSLFFTNRNAQQHKAKLRRCLGVKDSKKKSGARWVRHCTNKTNQSSDITIASSSPSVHLFFLTKRCLSLAKFCKVLLSRQNRQKTKRKASFSVDNSHCRLL